MAKFTEKIKTYNHYILALAGTIGIFILLFLAVLAFDEMTRSWSFNNPDYTDGIIATEETAELTKDSLRKQIISFNLMSLIDSANQIFVFPVGQARLEDEEYYDTKLYNMHSRGDLSMNYNSKTFNNLVIFNNVTSTSEVIFKQRLSISEYFIYNFEENKFIVITASMNDTNEDGILNSIDFQNLFIYDISKKALFEIETSDNITCLSSFVPQKSTMLLAHFGVDRNHNNDFDRLSEPKIFYKVDIKSMTLKEIIEAEKLDRLQKLLEGR